MKTLCCDVGTSSVRVAIIEYLHGNVLNTKPLAVATEPLTIHNKQTDFYEQSTQAIWSAFCRCVVRCLKESTLNAVESEHIPIEAIAFSATCSLVIVDGGDTDWDVIMWMDHRAKKEADFITKSGHKVLEQFGGTCSPEFSIAKLFWLYRNDRPRFEAATGFMELSDWMTYRCSSVFGFPHKFPRSLCCVTCKWGYDAQRREWPESLFNELLGIYDEYSRLTLAFMIYLGMTLDDCLRNRIGTQIVIPGVSISTLSKTAAKEMGFSVRTDLKLSSVHLSSSLIDAHSGVISMLIFGHLSEHIEPSKDIFENTFCMISGTSTCHMVLNKTHLYTKGVWGPYQDAIVPGYFLREAGQSATGRLIEHVIRSHFNNELPSSMAQIIVDLNQQLRTKGYDHRTDLIVNPTFHGNRSPLANSNLKGAIYGYTLEKSSLLDLYVATVEAIAYETRFIIEQIEHNSERIRRIIVTGGLTKHELYLQLHADILGVELVTFSVAQADLMLVGASVIAFTSTQIHADNEPNRIHLVELLRHLQIDSNGLSVQVFRPRTASRQYHQRKYACYHRLLDCCVQIESILSEVNA